MNGTITDTISTSTGRERAVCQYCGRQSRGGPPGRRLSLWHLPAGWSVAPYPDTHAHRDGSTGSRYTCAGCTRRLNRGELQLVLPAKTPVRPGDAS